jgi:hypothetical protein
MSATIAAQSNRTQSPPIEYTLDELRSYLPTGWELLEGGSAAWDPKRRALTVRVIDNVDFDWPVTVTAEAVEQHGRLAALDRAMDDTFRTRLGRPTRGLGIARRR